MAHMPPPPHWQILRLRHTGNERAVRIPLQCILVIGDSLRKPLEIEQKDFDVVGWTRGSCVLPLQESWIILHAICGNTEYRWLLDF